MARTAQQLMTQKEYAELRGVTPQYINKLVKQGKIAKVGKLIDARQADAAIKVFQRAGRVIMPTRRADKEKLVKAEKPRKAPTPRAPRGSNPETATHWRIEKEKYAALNAKLDHERNMGLLLDRDQVLHAERIKNERIRAALRALPRSLAPVVSKCASAAEAETLLREELDRVLQRLAEDPLGMKESAEAIPAAVAEPDPVPPVQTLAQLQQALPEVQA
jgi:hypothetical protein